MDATKLKQIIGDAYAILSEGIEAAPAAPTTTPDGGALLTVDTLRKFATSVPIPTRLTPMNPWQFAFAARVAALLMFAFLRGYTVAIGNAWTNRGCTVCGGGKRKSTSLHFDKLAIDLDLFRNGKWLDKTEDHRELGEFWESIGGAWGGRFNDGNHYSLAYNGRK